MPTGSDDVVPAKKMMTVDAVMSRDLEAVTPDTALMEIQERLHRRGFRHLLVIEDGRLVGVISDRDVLQAVSPFLDTLVEEPRDVKTLTRPARTVMRADPITVRPETRVDEAARLLLDHAISCLPVVAGDDEVIGIITSKDVLQHFVDSTSEGEP